MKKEGEDLRGSLFDIGKEEIDQTQLMKDYKNRVFDSGYDGLKKTKITTAGFVGWLGGKKRMAKRLINMMPPHDYYVEIFMGSAAVFFEKKKCKFNIINDFNNNLVNLYKVVAGSEEKFKDFVFMNYMCETGKVRFDEYLKLYETKAYDELPDVDRAFIYYYIINNVFNNDFTTRTFAHKFGGFTDNMFAKLIKSRKHLENTIIENMDYFYLIKKYNQKNRKVLFFADPPYVVADSGIYYEHVFNEDDHRALAYQMKEVDRKNCNFLMTYDDVPLIRELYKDFDIDEIEYTYTANKGDNSSKIELVIKNYNEKEQYSMF